MNASGQSNDRTWEVLCHLSALAMFVGIPFGNILGPLAVWLLKKNELPSVDEQGKESLNFQISITLYLIGLGAITVGSLVILIGFLLLPVFIGALACWWLVNLIFVVIAAIKASNGEAYRSPMTIRFIV